MARIKLADINAIIAPLSITAEGLKSIGFEPVAKEGSAKLYNAHDVPTMCRTLSKHLLGSAGNAEAAAAKAEAAARKAAA